MDSCNNCHRWRGDAALFFVFFVGRYISKTNSSLETPSGLEKPQGHRLLQSPHTEGFLVEHGSRTTHKTGGYTVTRVRRAGSAICLHVRLCFLDGLGFDWTKRLWNMKTGAHKKEKKVLKFAEPYCILYMGTAKANTLASTGC